MRYTRGPAVAASALPAAQALKSSIWLDEVSTYVRPYAIQHNSAGSCVVGQQIYRFPVTGPSSDDAFTLISTNAPGSDSFGVLPHIHQVHYENFFNFRGRFQLWTDKYGSQETRVLTQGDYGAVPHNITHTFQILDPDTEMVGVIQPGGFEDLFYALSSSSYSSSILWPYDPSASADSLAQNASIISSIQHFDVYAELDFKPRTDTINGAAPLTSTWRTGANALATEGGYKVIQQFVTAVQSAGNFSLPTITMDRLPSNMTVSGQSFAGHAAFEILDGQLMMSMERETLSLLQGDVIFIPGNTTYKYWSLVAYTKVLHIGQGAEGLDTTIIAGAMSWDSPVWPTS